ncbi:MAG TPA: diguanylate cyclase, partial [Gaiellales bacterium]|nr:diguanylate cyclase [Gaiellales bacterium]
AGFAVWAARTTYQSVNNVQRLTTVNDAFQDARHAIAQENLAARRYQLFSDPVHIQEYDQARAELDRSLTIVRALGSPHDLQVAATIEHRNQRASFWFAKLRAYERRRDIIPAYAVSDDRLQPLFDSMAATLNSSGRQHSAAALASLAHSRRSERVVVAITVITVALGILLLTAASAAMRYRERLERIRQRELERLKRAALTDSLSGLGNHRAFEEDLQRDLDHAAETGAELSLALLDLDGLKQTNDAHGHQVGDDCIRSVGAALSDAGPGTSAYRIGGDEFALIVHERRAVDTLYLVQHLQTHMAASPETRPVSASSGVAESCPTLGRDGLIRRADLALMQAKRSHRRCLLYNEALEPTLSTPDQVAEQRHTDALATALARAVDAKDAYTHSHCETVSELCGLIAQELGMGAPQIGRLRLAGLLHDVGKIGITDTILQKPGPLTDDEFTIMRTHTRLGHAIVSAAERPIEAEWILHHHERVDGGGYPDGLAGEQIPLESRIILVADAFEAITADRPYRMHRSADAAMVELERNAGTQFDPDCVAALGRVVRPQLRHVA